MEGEEIGMVLARASELRSKVNTCIVDRVARRDVEEGGKDDSGVEREEEEEEVEESLLSIRDAFASLEQQLSSLQDLQQQQLYERESTLAQIDRGRMILLSKLKEYKGEDLEVIHEAAAFAGGTIMHDDDLLLPPYPRHLPDTLVLDDLYTSNFVSKYKLSQNGLNGESACENMNNSDSLPKEVEPVGGNGWRSLRPIIWLVAKSALTIVSFMSVMSLAGFDPKLGRNGTNIKLSSQFQKSSGEEKQDPLQCPPGKILVIEDGESRCVVKERIEIPFDSDVTAPSLSYGFG